MLFVGKAKVKQQDYIITMNNHKLYIKTLDKTIPIVIEGDKTKPPLLIVTPAKLFQKKGYLPQSLKTNFCVYYADIFASRKNGENYSIDYSQLELKDFVSALHEVKTHVSSEKVALFAHSVLGTLVMEYMILHRKKVAKAVIMGTPPYSNGTKKQQYAEAFLKMNDKKRLEQFKKDQAKLLKEGFPCQDSHTQFIKSYNAKRALYFYFPEIFPVNDMWADVDFDATLAKQYYHVVGDRMHHNMFDRMLSNGFPDDIPLLMVLGMADASAPFYLWTDFIIAAHHHAKLANVDYFIATNTGHFVSIDEVKSFFGQSYPPLSKQSFFGARQRPITLLENQKVNTYINAWHHTTRSKL